MKILSFLTFLLLSVLSLSAQDLEAEAKALGDARKAAFEQGDVMAMMANYAEQVEYIGEDGEIVTLSRAEVKVNWEKTFQSLSGSIEFGPDISAALRPDGKVAMTGTFTQTMTNKETGESNAFKGSFHHQALRVDGKLLLCRMETRPIE